MVLRLSLISHSKFDPGFVVSGVGWGRVTGGSLTADVFYYFLSTADSLFWWSLSASFILFWWIVRKDGELIIGMYKVKTWDKETVPWFLIVAVNNKFYDIWWWEPDVTAEKHRKLKKKKTKSISLLLNWCNKSSRSFEPWYGLVKQILKKIRRNRLDHFWKLQLDGNNGDISFLLVRIFLLM